MVPFAGTHRRSASPWADRVARVEAHGGRREEGFDLAKLHRHALALGWLAAAAPALAGAQDLAPPEHYRLRLEYVRWRPSITGELQKGADEASGRVDIKDELGVQDKDANEFRAVLKLGGRHKLRASYTSLDYDGDVILDRAFIFDGTFFRREEQTVTSLKGALWSGDYELDVLHSSSGYLGLLLGAKFLDVDAVIVQPKVGRREAGTLRAPVPVLGACGRLYTGRISLSAEITGLSIGKRGRLYDFEGQARFHLSDRLAVGAGYRLLSVRGENDDDFIRLRDAGVRFGVEFGL